MKAAGSAPRRRGCRSFLLLCAVCALCGATPGAQKQSSTDDMRIGVLRDGSYDIVTVPLETYVARVLSGEALPGSEPAALESLAIAIRTYALGNRGKHRGEGFDLCDQTHCQVMRTVSPATERAALATAGSLLLYRGAPATVYYSASCGGRTEKPSHVWPSAQDVPYLPSRRDDGCGGSPEWSAEIAAGDLQRALHAAGFRGVLRNVRIASRNESGRVAQIGLDGLTPSTISGQDLRAAIGRTLGWRYLQSTAFELRRSGRGFRFRGQGAGHGVGMCVIGSTKLATAGESVEHILGRYFPGTTIGTIGTRAAAEAPAAASPISVPPRTSASGPPPGGVSVLLAEGGETDRTAVATLAANARDELARTLAIAAPPQLTLRFHPTTDAYERATGQPWFTLGNMIGSELHFVPLAILRERGVVERALRRQLVHLLTGAALAGRPQWVREGAALHFSERAHGGLSRAICPPDAELLRPASIGALGDAYARAHACFERQISAGREWRDVK